VRCRKKHARRNSLDLERRKRRSRASTLGCDFVTLRGIEPLNRDPAEMVIHGSKEELLA
jgi:hypothetical protein